MIRALTALGAAVLLTFGTVVAVAAPVHAAPRVGTGLGCCEN